MPRVTGHLFFGIVVILLAYIPAFSAFSEDHVRQMAKSGELDSAFRVCQAELKKNSSNYFCLNMSGKLAIQGKFSQANFDKILNSKSPPLNFKEEALFKSGQYFYALGSYLRASQLFARGQSVSSNRDSKIQSTYWLGQSQVNLGYTKPDYLDSAETTFIGLLKDLRSADYFYALALEGLAKVRISKGEWTDADETISMALEYAKPDQRSGLAGLKFRIAEGNNQRPLMKSLAKDLLTQYPLSMEANYISGKYPQMVSKLALSAPTQENRPQPKTVQSAGIRGFCLQIGAFSSRARASEVQSEHAAKGLKTHVKAKETSTGKIFTISTQSFPTRKEALQFGQKKLKALGISYYVVEQN